MAIEDQETIITVNEADWRDGYFTFGTSRPADFQKLIRRCPKDKLIDLRESTREGKTTYWNCKVPSEYLSRSTFSLRRPCRKPPSEAQILARHALGRAAKERRQKHA